SIQELGSLNIMSCIGSALSIISFFTGVTLLALDGIVTNGGTVSTSMVVQASVCTALADGAGSGVADRDRLRLLLEFSTNGLVLFIVVILGAVCSLIDASFLFMFVSGTFLRGVWSCDFSTFADFLIGLALVELFTSDFGLMIGEELRENSKSEGEEIS